MCPFRRCGIRHHAYPTRRLPAQGTMVYGIVKQSGGHIEVYSEAGRGTTFKIYLPQVSEMGQRVPAEVAAEPLGGPENILLVEDEEAVRALARRILETHGYTVLEASSAETALALAETYAGPVHLLVTDTVLPRAGGPELARRLSPSRPDLKVLFISGYTDDAAVRHGLLNATHTLLQKPFSPDAFARKVREVLDRAEPRAQAARLGST